MLSIDWIHFTPWASLAGGLLIGLSAAIFILINGRILGVSGIVGGLLHPQSRDIGWRLLFILGMLAAPILWTLLMGSPISNIDSSWTTLLIAGLLVGLGTRLGSGCTSGHGVCGISRLSPRSFAATLIFMAVGFITVYVIRHGLN
ncbi:MAG: YeeE/YedE family protein [Paralcaligenes sp.]